MIERPGKFYKYLPAARIDVLKNLRIRFTQPGSFNDPFDCRPPACFTRQSKIDPIRVNIGPIAASINPLGLHELKTRVDPWDDRGQTDMAIPGHTLSITLGGGFVARDATRDLGILSLSATWENLLMWSHYSDSHRGFVIGFRPTHAFFGPDTKVCLSDRLADIEGDLHVQTLPVDYDSRRARPSQDGVSLNDCIRKGEDWKYEQEWRSFRSLGIKRESVPPSSVNSSIETLQLDQFGNPIVLVEIPPDAIQEILLGVSCPPKTRALIAQEILNRKDLAQAKVFSCTCDPSQFGLRRQRVDLQSLAEESLDVMTSDAFEVERSIADLREAVSRLDDGLIQEIAVAIPAGSFAHLAIANPTHSRILTNALHHFAVQELLSRRLSFPGRFLLGPGS